MVINTKKIIKLQNECELQNKWFYNEFVRIDTILGVIYLNVKLNHQGDTIIKTSELLLVLHYIKKEYNVDFDTSSNILDITINDLWSSMEFEHINLNLNLILLEYSNIVYFKDYFKKLCNTNIAIRYIEKFPEVIKLLDLNNFNNPEKLFKTLIDNL